MLRIKKKKPVVVENKESRTNVLMNVRWLDVVDGSHKISKDSEIEISSKEK